MRSLGDGYVKAGLVALFSYLLSSEGPSPSNASPILFFTPSEFRRHKDVTNPWYIIGFLSQWKVYLDQIPAGPEAQRFRGKKLDPTIYEKVRRKLLPPSMLRFAIGRSH
jgi:hypothetical protein